MAYVPPHLRGRPSEGPPSGRGPPSDRRGGAPAGDGGGERFSGRGGGGGGRFDDRSGGSGGGRFNDSGGGRFNDSGGGGDGGGKGGGRSDERGSGGGRFDDRGGGYGKGSDRFGGGGNRFDDRTGGGGSARFHDGHPPPQRRSKGAPSRFGSVGKRMDGALRDGEDVPGGTRVDVEGMVYEMADGSVRYFQDRGRKYPFSAGPEALPLLRGLLTTNNRVFAINKSIVDATGDAAATIRHGEALYADKPTMKAHHGALGTWSDEEYAHPGLQAVYLRLKSFQRFTESWALLERAARFGVFERYLAPPSGGGGGGDAQPSLPLLHVASLGGGPGYELLAFEWFLDFWAAAGRQGSAAEAHAWLCSRRGLGAGHGHTTAAAASSSSRGDGAFDGSSGTGEGASGGDGSTGGSGGGEDGGGATGTGTGTGTGDGGGTGGAMPALTAAAAAIDVSDGAAAPPSARGTDATPSAVAGQPPPLRLVSLDLQPSWEPYVLALPSASSTAAYSFAQWNIKETVDAVTRSACPRLDVCLISNVLVYCTDEPTADVLTALLTVHGVHCILINERGAEQKMVEMVERRGVVVTRLMDQSGGRDDRQLLLLPPGTPRPVEAGTAARGRAAVFPNVPYEENKYE